VSPCHHRTNTRLGPKFWCFFFFFLAESQFHGNYQRVYEFLASLYSVDFDPESATQLSEEDWSVIEFLLRDMQASTELKGCGKQIIFLQDAAKKISIKVILTLLFCGGDGGGLKKIPILFCGDQEWTLALSPNPLTVPLTLLNPFRFMKAKRKSHSGGRPHAGSSTAKSSSTPASAGRRRSARAANNPSAALADLGLSDNNDDDEDFDEEEVEAEEEEETETDEDAAPVAARSLQTLSAAAEAVGFS